jgi:hypothetical protein
LPPGLELINENAQHHWHWTRKARAARTIRNAAGWAARAADIPTLDRAHITYIIHIGSRRRFDPHNWNPSAKAAIDGIVDAGVLADDDSTHLLGLEARAGHLVKGHQLELVITEVTE